MKTITRLGMFETNSSSMHSIVISKQVDSNNKKSEDYKVCYTFDNYRHGRNGERDIVYMNLSQERENTNYSRQEGKIVITPDDKLYMYLVLGAYRLWNNIYVYADDNEKSNPYEFESLFSDFVADLQRRIFDPLNVNLVVAPPVILKNYYNWNDGEPSYSLQWLPYIEDSFETFDDLFDYLKGDDRALYSFIFNMDSFVILGGDEYESTFALNKIIRRGINYDSKLFGYIEDPK